MVDAQLEMIANRYQLHAEIGRGGMGVVHLAYDRLTERDVAVKRIAIDPADLAFNSRTPSRDQRLSLAREFRILASLRHPNIIEVLDYGFDEQPFFTMTYINNARTFSDVCATRNLSDKLELLYQLLQAIHYLHRRNIIHRDLKPQNILVNDEGQLRVLDFGLAIEGGARQQLAGTVFYLAPEILNGQPASFKSDLYAVGMIALEALTGSYPIEHQHRSNLVQKILTTQIILDDFALPEPLKPHLRQLLDINPDNRPSDLQPLIDALRDLMGSPEESAAVRDSFISAAQFIGRNEELKQLERSLRQIRRKKEQSAMWLIRGEAGAGKSRLADELRIRATIQEDVLVLEGTAAESGGLPFQLWRSALRKLVLYAEVGDLQASVLKEIVPDIAGLLDRPIGNPPPVTGRAYWRRLGEAVLDLFKQQDGSILLILDDLHRADESLFLLEYLVRRLSQIPRLMILGTYQDDAEQRIETLFPDAQVITLNRLSRANISRLSESMLGEVGTQKSIVNLLKRETEGNTFFIVEVIRDLAQLSGGLQHIGHTTLPETVFTSSMQQMLERHLNQVPEAYKPILLVAAIAGRFVDVSILTAIFDEEQVNEWLYICSAAAILDVEENIWEFSHDKIREAILLDVDPSIQADIHAQIANAIESVYPNEDDYAPILLEHWHEAGQVDRATDYLIVVVKRMVEITDEHKRAQRLIQRGVRVLPQNNPHHARLLNLLAFSFGRQGDMDAGEEAVLQVMKLAQLNGQKDEEALARTNLGIFNVRRGNYPEAVQQLEIALRLASGTGASVVLARSYNHLGLINTLSGNSSGAINYYEQSIAIYDATGDSWGAAMTMNNLGMEYARVGNFERSFATLQRGLTIRENAGDQWGVASSLNNMGLVATWQQNYLLAAEYLQNSYELYRGVGAKRDIANVLANLSIVELHLGRDSAQASLEEGIALAYAVGATPIVLELLAGYAWFLDQQGNRLEAFQLVAGIQQHPAFNVEVQEKLDEWLDEPDLEPHIAADLNAFLQSLLKTSSPLNLT